MGITTDPDDPALGHGTNETPVAMNEKYLVLSEEERKRGFERPLRQSYVHTVCGQTTSMGFAIAETYARKPDFYGATYCVTCGMHRRVGAEGEFVWVEKNGKVAGNKVGA